MKEISKNVILVNDRLQLEMKEAESGNTIRTLLHFGAYTERLDKHIFKGKKELRSYGWITTKIGKEYVDFCCKECMEAYKNEPR